MTFDEYTGLYFYSAIFQGNMALLAFAGVFAVFKIQLLAQSIQVKENEIKTFLKIHYTSNSFTLPEELRSRFDDLPNIMTHINALIDNSEYRPSSRIRLEHLPKSETLTTMLSELNSMLSTRTTLLKGLLPPFGSIVVIVLTSAILIPFASQIHIFGSKTEGLIFGLVLLAQAISVFVNGRFVFAVLKS